MTAKGKKSRSASFVKNRSVVHVRWDDSCSYSRWQAHAEIDRFAVETEPLINSAGIVVGDTPTHLTIVQSISSHNKEAAMKIPKVAIESVREIGKI